MTKPKSSNTRPNKDLARGDTWRTEPNYHVSKDKTQVSTNGIYRTDSVLAWADHGKNDKSKSAANVVIYAI